MSNAALRALISRTCATYSAGCTRASCSSLAAGASWGTQPTSHSRLSSSASIARIRSARSGCPWPVSCSSEAGWRKNGGIRAGTVPARRGRDAPHRRRSGRRRRSRSLRRARGGRPGRQRGAGEPLAAGASAVDVLAEESPDRVRDLQRLGVQFDADRSGNLALGLEGGHSRRRIVHAGGAATGRRITRALSALAATHERVRVLEPVAAVALWL